MYIPMTPQDYAKHWDLESTRFATEDIYNQLSKLAPAESTLEVGCGAGWSTLSLAKNRPVLAIDNNAHLIELALSRLGTHGVTAEIINSDLFEPSGELLKAITEFQPKGVVGWFIGSHPADNDKRTPANLSREEKSLVYRENVEDRLVALPLCPASVEWVHTSVRVKIPSPFIEDQFKALVTDDYNANLFMNSGFSVTEVHLFSWDQGTLFPYVQAAGMPQGASTPVIISILARRM